MSRDAGAAVGQGGVIELSAVETYKKVVTNYARFYLATMVTSKIITEILEKPFWIFWVREWLQ